MTAFEYFTRAEQCEATVAEMYGWLARAFARDPIAAELFRRLADEEVQHAARMRLLRSRNLHEPGLFRQQADLPDVDAALEHARRELEAVRNGRWGDDAAYALRRAAELEERFGDFHAEVLTRFVQPDLQGFFSTLVQQDRAHRDLLWHAASRTAANG